MPSQSLVEQMLRESGAMTRYALSLGIPVPSWIIELLQAAPPDGSGVDIGRLVDAHGTLVRLVAPATPRALAFIDGHDSIWAVPLMRQMFILAVVCLIGFILVSLSSDINDSRSGNLFTSKGLPLLLNEVFVLFAAAIGASFSILFDVNRYVRTGTYEPKYTALLWIRFLLGLLSGFILAAVLHLDSATSTSTTGTAMATQLSSAAVALLGGFGCTVVYTLLNRLIGVITGMFGGDPAMDNPPATDLGALPKYMRAALRDTRVDNGAAAQPALPDGRAGAAPEPAQESEPESEPDGARQTAPALRTVNDGP